VAHVAATTAVELRGRGQRDELDVVGLGSALVDVLAEVDDALPERLGLVRGSMTLVDLDRAAEIYEAMGETVEVSGGSAANTIAGIASLGGRAGFAGKVANDQLGEVFRDDFTALDVELDLAMASGRELATGRCHVLVTGDGERTMATHLGVANTLAPGDLDTGLFSRAKVTYLEGYLFDLPPAKAAIREVVELAHDGDGAVALSLSDSFCVERHRNDFLELVNGGVDLVFANEHEAMALFRSSGLQGALEGFDEAGVLAAVTLGARGVAIVTPVGVEMVPAREVDHVVDATGAGDLFAAGFLFALARGADPLEAARLGAVCAAEVLEHLGARPLVDLAELATSAGLL
jgi:sugar/nucleoside kinase (ribokinase family)